MKNDPLPPSSRAFSEQTAQVNFGGEPQFFYAADPPKRVAFRSLNVTKSVVAFLGPLPDRNRYGPGEVTPTLNALHLGFIDASSKERKGII